MISASTKLFISVSKTPTTFGATVYKALFEKYGIDAIYLPRQAPDSAEALVTAIKTCGIAGCSVSMPLKQKVVPFLDSTGHDATETKAVNTIINKDGKLHGENTDVTGIFKALELHKMSSALVYGTGATAGSMACALKKLGVSRIAITGRDHSKAKGRAAELAIEYAGSVAEILTEGSTFDLFANVTPGSSEETHEMQKLVERGNTVFDSALSKAETPLLRAAGKIGKRTISGVEMYCAQVQRQFELYTGSTPAISDIKNILSESLL